MSNPRFRKQSSPRETATVKGREPGLPGGETVRAGSMSTSGYTCPSPCKGTYTSMKGSGASMGTKFQLS